MQTWLRRRQLGKRLQAQIHSQLSSPHGACTHPTTLPALPHLTPISSGVSGVRGPLGDSSRPLATMSRQPPRSHSALMPGRWDAPTTPTTRPPGPLRSEGVRSSGEQGSTAGLDQASPDLFMSAALPAPCPSPHCTQAAAQQPTSAWPPYAARSA